MSRIIVYSDYLKPTEKRHMNNTLTYNGQREGVELNPSEANDGFDQVLGDEYKGRSVSERQKNLIYSLMEAAPAIKDEFVYQEYLENPTMISASALITESLERMKETAQENEVYLKYISERPGVEKNEDDIGHGLFDAAGSADLQEYQKEIQAHQGNMWRDIISLRREDAIATGFDHQAAWRKLLQAKMPTLAAQLGIPESDFRWCAAFHDESYHPHVHIMFWDAKGKNGFQDTAAIEKFKSSLANHIFANEMYLHKELKGIYRTEMEDAFRSEMDQLMKKTLPKLFDEQAEILLDQLEDLSKALKENGKKVYSYQTPQAKMITDKIVEQMIMSKPMKKLLIQYMTQEKALADFYKENNESFIEQKLQQLIHPGKGDRKVLHNAVIQAGYELKQLNFIQKVEADALLPQLKRAIRYTVVADAQLKKHCLGAAVRLGTSLKMSPGDIVRFCHHLGDEEKIMEEILDNKDQLISKKDLQLLNQVYKQEVLKETRAPEEIFSTQDLEKLAASIKAHRITSSDLLRAVVKVCMNAEMSPGDILDFCSSMGGDEEQILETCLEVKGQPLTNAEAHKLREDYGLEIKTIVPMERKMQIVKQLMVNVTALFEGNTIEEEREIRRLRRIRRLDELQKMRNRRK